MSSGIYKLTFSSGMFYYGRSDDIDRRWQEHILAFQNGTAAQRMQLEYNQFGMPQFEVMYECHVDHIDLAESALIQFSDRDNSLNAQIPRRISNSDWETICECQELLQVGTVDHLRMIYQHNQKYLAKNSEVYELKGQLARKQEELDQLKASGIYCGDEAKLLLADYQEESEVYRELLDECYAENSELKLQIEKLKGMSLWQRIFSWPH